MAPSKEGEESGGGVNRKKRLSRREQKARKKQRKQQEQSQDKSRSTVASKEATAKASQSKESAAFASSAWKAAPVQEDIPYVPTPIPDLEDHSSPNKKQSNQKTLGKWFPKARVVKSQPSATDHCTILLFYQYKSPVVWSENRVAQLMQYLQAIAQARPTLGGRLRVAPEGINATLSAGCAPDQEGRMVSGRTILEHFTKDLQQFDDIFFQTDFKNIPAKADRHFKDLKILPVQELVFYGLDDSQAPLGETGVHLEAQDFHDMLHDQSKETVVVDVRNHYEAALGRFDGQESKGGATYIDPLMRKSTDFPSWVAKAADDLKGKRVMMYCTGGVRCERASAYLKKTMGDDLEGVYQLQGGIERYMQAFPDGGYWRGSNFVFDKRESVSADNPNGDGGVVKKRKHDNKNAANDIQTYCCLCDKPWDRYVGKKKCETCGVPVLMCDACMSTRHTKSKKKKKKKHKTDNPNEEKEEPQKLARCPLCVDQNITVPVEEVEYTDNGVKSKSHSDQGKAAPSVLKWGGGHATEKKERRRHRKQQLGVDAKEDTEVG